MTMESELACILKGDRDNVDAQFNKNLKIVIDRAAHHALINKAFSVPSKQHMQVCTSILWAYYRSVYFASGYYGGIIMVLPDQQTIQWTSHLLIAFLGMRDVEAKMLDAAKMCPAMRDNKEAAGYNKCRIITGIPFEGMMSWDITNIMACCDLKESIVLSTKPPDKWDVRATQKGDVIRLESQMSEVFDLKAAVDRIRKK